MQAGRWTSKDPSGLAGGMNLYEYAGGDSVNFIDQTGLALDTVVDVVSIGYGIYRIFKDNIFGKCKNLGTNLLALGADSIGLVVPFVGGLGAGVRTARAARKVGSVRKADLLRKRSCFVEGTVVHPVDKTKPIETIKVGDLVWSKGDNFPGHFASSSSHQFKRDREHVSPKTWRSLQLEVNHKGGSSVKLSLLRPLWWIKQKHVHMGGTFFLTMPEMGIEGVAKILEIGPCRADSRKIPPGSQIVVGKFEHRNAIVLALVFKGAGKSLGVTPNHPIYSEDRMSYTRAGLLRIGERVKTQDGSTIQMAPLYFCLLLIETSVKTYITLKFIELIITMFLP